MHYVHQVKYIFLVCFFCLLSIYSKGQIDTINIQGVVSSSVPVNPLNIPVSLTYYDQFTIIARDTVYTDSMGFYTSTYIDSMLADTIDRVDIRLPSCTASASFISKQQIVPPWVGFVSYTVNFTNYCFSVEFSYFVHDDSVDFNSTVVGGVSPYTYYWDFGDGSQINNQVDPSHFYSVGGPNYNVILQVVDTNLDTTSFSNSFNINDCIANFSYSQLGTNTISFANLSTTPNTPSYLWDFGDSTISDSVAPTHIYPGSGNYDVCLEVTDSMAFCKSTFCALVNVNNQCNSIFTATQQGNIVAFQNLSTSSLNVLNLKYNWDFTVDQSSEKDPVEVYDQNGQFPVRLIIIDTVSNCIDTSEQVVQITNIPVNSLILSGQVLLNGQINDTRTSLIGGNGLQGLTVIDSTPTFKGYYSFAVNGNSTYYVRGEMNSGHPDSKFIVPTYYEKAFIWENARSILVSNGSVHDNNIDLSLKKPIVGQATIQGLVSKYSGSQQIPNTPIKNVMMILSDENNTVLSTDYTLSNGKYSFSGIGVDKYKVYASIPGKYTYPSFIEITSANQLVDSVDFTIFEGYIQAVENKENDVIKRIYPNPAKEKVFVQFKNVLLSEIIWQIIRADGRQVLQDKDVLSANKTLEIDVSKLEHGFYILHFAVDGEEGYTSLIISR